MKRVINTEKIPLLLWTETLEEEAMNQARHLANLECAFHHVAIMADAHVGYGMPIGGVLAATGAVIPNAVGVDIGCGMQAVRTGLAEASIPQLKRILAGLRAAVPLGFKHHRKPCPLKAMPEPGAGERDLPVVMAEFGNARHQIGTLGGGNHFIEMQRGNDGRIWLMIHSGSRNLGYKVAGHYNALAAQLAQKAGRGAAPKEW